MGKMGFGTLYRSLLRPVSGRRNRFAVDDLDPAERNFRHIWRYVKFTSNTRYPPRRSRQNLLVLQMGKVASLAIQNAIHIGGVNAFHCHELSLARQQRTIANLLTSELTFSLASHELRLHIHNAALAMLVRWYQANKRYHGRKLKVVTLTRDPVAHYKSWFIQRLHRGLPAICAWQCARRGLAAEASVDPIQAVQDVVSEAASIIAAAGAEDREACLALARERWPAHPAVAAEAGFCLRSLTWFDTEIREVFGLDPLAGRQLREQGWAAVENDWVEILALKFEQLGALVPRLAEFAGVPSLTLREINVTQRKAGASEYKAAIQAAIDTPTGQAYERALRASPYARACGYERASPEGAATS